MKRKAAEKKRAFSKENAWSTSAFISSKNILYERSTFADLSDGKKKPKHKPKQLKYGMNRNVIIALINDRYEFWEAINNQNYIEILNFSRFVLCD